MDFILKKIFTGTAYQAIQKILEIYAKKRFCIVNYLYFAQIGAQRLFEKPTKGIKIQVQQFKNFLLEDYKKLETSKIRKLYMEAIKNADVLLPDGIALQIFYFLLFHKRLYNLNGTDFCPIFLEYVHKHYKMNLILYGTYPDLLVQTKKYLEKKGYTVSYVQDGYNNLDWKKVQKNLDLNAINILLVARSNIDYPVQEIRTYANQEEIKKNKLIVLNQGGTFDFRVGKQKRAPKILRKIKLERLWRVISDPQRNSKKIRYTLYFFKYIFSYLLLKIK